MAIEVSTEEAKLLAEIGFVGIGRDFAGPSKIVFMALGRVRPDEEAAPIGLALVALAQKEPQRAVSVLRDAPQTEAVIAFRAIAYAQVGEIALARELRDELSASGAEAALLTMAGGALTGADLLVK